MLFLRSYAIMIKLLHRWTEFDIQYAHVPFESFPLNDDMSFCPLIRLLTAWPKDHWISSCYAPYSDFQRHDIRTFGYLVRVPDARRCTDHSPRHWPQTAISYSTYRYCTGTRTEEQNWRTEKTTKATTIYVTFLFASLSFSVFIIFSIGRSSSNNSLIEYNGEFED